MGDNIIIKMKRKIKKIHKKKRNKKIIKYCNKNKLYNSILITTYVQQR